MWDPEVFEDDAARAKQGLLADKRLVLADDDFGDAVQENGFAHMAPGESVVEDARAMPRCVPLCFLRVLCFGFDCVICGPASHAGSGPNQV